MVFSSVLFLFRFLPIFIICYFLAPQRIKNLILFLGSLLFYAWGEPVYVLLMLFSTVSDYCLGLGIAANKGKVWAKMLLLLSIILNLGVLSFFKYADFVVETINMIAGVSIPLLNLPLPLGISFYTFQTMSYTIDVYRGEAKAQKNLLDFGVFVTMFPQLIAGPIVKYTDVQEVIHSRKTDIRQISYGCQRFIVGLAKKVLLANNIGALWEEISCMDYNTMPAMTAWLGIIAFALQIYFDFSGYSDMAIGLGACLGFTFPENFRHPYFAQSVTDFWRKWHITLSSWFKEYVYLPLGGNRHGIKKQIRNILIVWVLTGIWHGAGFNFLLWGLWFAFWLIAEKILLFKFLEKLPIWARRCYAMFIVLLGWVLFALENLGDVSFYILAMFGFSKGFVYDAQSLYLVGEYGVLIIIGIFGCMPYIHKAVEFLKDNQSGYMIALRRVLEKVVLALLLLLSIAYVVEASYNPFLYFRF
ncbi:MBOAT family protein [Lachnospiraceae bacterium OttesenSCG-928-D06]|nr:MBOAT family protein [Lachnospiraceae bacterium OttesenSCG-928-D06]